MNILEGYDKYIIIYFKCIRRELTSNSSSCTSINLYLFINVSLSFNKYVLIWEASFGQEVTYEKYEMNQLEYQTQNSYKCCQLIRDDQ